MKRQTIQLLLALLAFHGNALASQTPTQGVFTLYSNQPSDSPSYIWLSKAYRELYRRLGIDVTIVSVPEARASILAETGTIDGQFGRVWEYLYRHNSQIRINEPLYQVTLVAYVHADSGISLKQGWKSFHNTPLSVEYRRGVLVAQQNLERTVSADRLSTITNIRNGLLKVKRKRVDVFVQADVGALPFINSEEFANEVVSAGKMQTVAMYHYIHEQYAHLQPAMEIEILAMKEAGLIRRYCLEAFSASPSSCQDHLLP
ncbi:hypothetical protein [Aliagarivorans taiwanensis]|uniref:hypothetical protein n=1 Tax=Aliagarivorans taiwanensis TaxID=561966 RepID=UPI000406A5E7|nr:hypothetical protein [Aliagarivorans taiwanensis]